MTQPPREKLFDLVKDFDTSVLVTREGNGELRGRPMELAEVSKSEGIWFATDRGSSMLDDIAGEPKVCLVMQSKQHFVSLSGIATVHTDNEKVHELWKASWKIWFPKGKDDPDIRLIQVSPTAGDYWDLSGKSRWNVLWEMGEAYCFNRQPNLDKDHHSHVEL